MNIKYQLLNNPKLKRTLMLLVWAPGVGKSSWIKSNNLEDCAISTDDFRLKIGWYSCNTNWHIGLSQNMNKHVFDIIHRIIELRMTIGLFTILDATNCSTSWIKDWVELAHKNNFDILLNIFDMPLEQIKKQNEERKNTLTEVPDYALEKIYNDFINLKNWKFLNLPYIKTTITKKISGNPPEFTTDFSTFLTEKELKFDTWLNWKDTFVFWDIHGVPNIIDEVEKIVNNPENKDKRFVFCGDMIDKWTDNIRIIDNILNWKHEWKDIITLRGNHERHIRKVLYDMPMEEGKKYNYLIKELKTYPKNKLKEFDLWLLDNIVLTHSSINFYISHGGISNIEWYGLKDRIPFAEKEFVNGSWRREEIKIIEENFMNNMLKNNILKDNKKHIQIHWHRNSEMWEIKNHNNYNLEQGVTKWLYFAYLYITKEGIVSEYKIKSNFIFNDNNNDE